MTLAALHLLAAVVAALLAALGRLDRLAVDVTGLRVGVAARDPADTPAQGGKQLLPGAVVDEGAEVVVDGFPGTAKIVGDGSPGAALAVVVEQGIEHLAHVVLAGAAAGLRRGNELLQDRP